MPEDEDPEHAVDPFAPRETLAAAGARTTRSRARAGIAPVVVKTALVAQVREGHLYVYMPPLHRLEDYLALLEVVEGAARQLRHPVAIERYPPSRDPRIAALNVTPDPGVIEVNVQPATTWTELMHLNDVRYAQAREARLATEKFMLDGRHSGTGGGNHVTLGGATPADSPLLRGLTCCAA